MMDLFTSAEKAAFAAPLDDLHDTFGRDIIVMFEPNRTIINTGGNPLFKEPREASDVVFVPNSTTIKARILHGKPSNVTLSERTKYNDASVDIPEGQVRIKIALADYDVLREARRITLDNQDYIVDSHSRGHGLFDVNYYTFYLKPINAD